MTVVNLMNRRAEDAVSKRPPIGAVETTAPRVDLPAPNDPGEAPRRIWQALTSNQDFDLDRPRVHKSGRK